MGIINQEKSLVQNNTKELVKIEDGEILVNGKDESEMISGFFDKLIARSRKLDEIEEKIKEALQNSEEAEESAEIAGNKPVKWYNFKKPVFEALQKAGIDLAKASTVNAETNKLILEYLFEQAEFDKFIITIGILNNIQQ